MKKVYVLNTFYEHDPVFKQYIFCSMILTILSSFPTENKTATLLVRPFFFGQNVVIASVV